MPTLNVKYVFLILYREGGDQALDILHKADVPLLVFSAGVGDVIDECFKQRYKMFDNMHIIANWMDFNHQVNDIHILAVLIVFLL